MLDLDIDDAVFSELDEVIAGLTDASRGHGPGSTKMAVARGTEESLYEDVLPSVQARAAQHIGDEASEIDAVTIGWNGRSFSVGLEAGSEIVRAHEYGSGRHAGGGGGYRIGGGDEPIAFQAGGQTIVVEYVVHPGVRGKAFMRRGAHSQAGDIGDEIADEVADTLRDAVSTSR